MNIGWVASLPPQKRQTFLNGLSKQEVKALYWYWPFWARDDQLPPDGDWTSWLLLGGRGAGKTRSGAEWVRALVEADDKDSGCRNIALIGETLAAARQVMVEGPSGLLSVSPPYFKPRFYASRNMLIWPNGARAYLFSAMRPENLRGPQFDAAWCDELAKWRYDEMTWDMLQFGLRLGDNPRQVVTTTPKPTALIKRLLADPKCVVTRAGTKANIANLAPSFMKDIVGRYEGTRLGRQELDAELLEDTQGALWNYDLLTRQRCSEVPEFVRIIVAVDPPVGSGPKADACGIIALGLSAQGYVYVLDDCSVQGLSPAKWARRVIDAYHDYEASALVAEINQGGELIRELIIREQPDVNYQAVRATRGKLIRAEPVAALYERGKVFHIGRFDALEKEMCQYDGHGASPDRLDALVWGVTELLLRRKRAIRPTMRRL